MTCRILFFSSSFWPDTIWHGREFLRGPSFFIFFKSCTKCIKAHTHTVCEIYFAVGGTIFWPYVSFLRQASDTPVHITSSYSTPTSSQILMHTWVTTPYPDNKSRVPNTEGSILQPCGVFVTILHKVGICGHLLLWYSEHYPQAPSPPTRGCCHRRRGGQHCRLCFSLVSGVLTTISPLKVYRTHL